MSNIDTRYPRDSRRVAVSLAEVIVSLAIVGGLMVSALNTLGGAAMSYGQLNHGMKGQLLAQELLNEILVLPYAEAGGGTFGPDVGETGSTRAAFDDVDDFHNWSASPPELVEGTDLSNLEGWTRAVKVHYVKSTNVNSISLVESGIKRITVTVSFHSKPVAALSAIRSSGSDQSLNPDTQAVE